MRAISIHQPYATLIAIGQKLHETRHWPTTYQGPIAIHATKNLASIKLIIRMLYEMPNDQLALALKDAFGTANARGTIEKLQSLPTGVIVCTARITGCWHAESLKPSFKDRMFGEWGYGCFAWRMEDVKPLPRPIPATGKQGFWDWTQG